MGDCSPLITSEEATDKKVKRKRKEFPFTLDVPVIRSEAAEREQQAAAPILLAADEQKPKKDNLSNETTPEPSPKVSLAKARWRKAIWYVTQEAKKRRSSNSYRRLSKAYQETVPHTPTFVSALRRNSSLLPLSPYMGAKPTRKLSLVKKIMCSKDMSMSVPDLNVQMYPRRRRSSWKHVASSRRSSSKTSTDLLVPPLTPKRFDMPTILNSSTIVLVSWLATCYVMFVPDLYQYFSSSSHYDMLVTAISQLCWTFFLTEFILRSTNQERYIGSIYFWLDFMSIVAILPDILWISSLQWTLSYPVRIVVLARSWHAARAGTHMACSLQIQQRPKHSRTSFWIPLELVWERSDEEFTDHALHRSIVKRCCAAVAILVLLLFGQARMAPSFYLQLENDLKIISTSFVAGAGRQVDDRAFNKVLDLYVSGYARRSMRLLYLEVDGVKVYGDEEGIKSMRTYPPEAIAVTLRDFDDLQSRCVAHVEFRESARLAAGLRALTAVFVSSVLFFLSWSLAGIVRHQIVRPLDSIANKISKMVDTPLEPLECDMHLQPQMKKIERGLFSLARLLQLGFGEAGASVISRSLATGAMTALATNRPGSIVNAFFGFCDIRNFTVLTELLQADVVKLVNSVARLLHGCVIRSHGDPNKNIGDAFLLVWKPKKGIETISEIADGALRAYVECILEMSRDVRLSQHINLQSVQQALQDGHMKMGFGLHFGWAVECVIGSKHKVDVSYLSPHVNMSSRLEAATKQYGVSILMSGDVVGLLSWDIKRLCRLIDRVTVKGSTSPIDLYTFDEPSMRSRGGTVPDDIDFSSLQSSRAFFEVAAPSTDSEFRRDFARAISVYLGGPDGSRANWPSAMDRLRACLRKRPGDGPTLAILRYMEGEMAKPLESRVQWMGYRMLEHK